jgi:hypothetical protein
MGSRRSQTCGGGTRFEPSVYWTARTEHCRSAEKGAENIMARKYSKKAGETVHEAMHKFKQGKLKSGTGSHKKVTNPKQAIAIGLSEARKKGAKVPAKKKS